YGCGYSDGDFSELRLSESIDDLAKVIDWSRSEVAGNQHAVVLAQSFGTAVAALLGAQQPDAFSAAVLWNLSADIYNRYQRLFGKDIATSDVIYLEKGLGIGRAFMDDARGYDVVDSFRSWQKPVLFLNS